MQLFAALALMGLLSGVASQTDTTLSDVTMFDCKRAGITCGADEPCDNADSKICACRPGTTTPVQNVNCVADADATTACSDPAKCGTFGTCFATAAGVDTCYCDQLHYGENCENSRVELTCDLDALKIDVTPFGTFAGRIYAKDNIDDTNCALTDTSGTLSSTFNFDLTDATNCGVAKADLLSDPADPTTKIGNMYTVTVVVQYDMMYVIGTDQELTLTCNYPDTATVNAVVFETDATLNLDDDGTGTAEGSPLIFSIADSADAAIAEAATVNVGDELNVKIALSVNDVYTLFLIEECTATNSLADSDPNYAVLNFVDSGGCPSDNQVVRGDHTVAIAAGVSETVTIPLYAFMFVSGAAANKNNLLFTCTVKLCDAASAADCAQPTCTNNQAAAITGKRRRRAADDSVVTIGQGLVVRFGNTTLEEETTESAGGSGSQGATDTGACLKNPDLQTIIAVLGFSLLLLFVAVCVLVFVLCRRRSRDRQHDKFVDDGVSMGSSRQTLQLPRPRV